MKTIKAMYVDGVFKPEGPVSLPSGSWVEVVVPEGDDPVAILKARYPDSFGGVSDEEAAEMTRDIDEAFEKSGRRDRLNTSGMVTGDELRARFPGAAGAWSKQDHDEIMAAIDEEFGKIDPDEWR